VRVIKQCIQVRQKRVARQQHFANGSSKLRSPGSWILTLKPTKTDEIPLFDSIFACKLFIIQQHQHDITANDNTYSIGIATEVLIIIFSGL